MSKRFPDHYAGFYVAASWPPSASYPVGGWKGDTQVDWRRNFPTREEAEAEARRVQREYGSVYSVFVVEVPPWTQAEVDALAALGRETD